MSFRSTLAGAALGVLVAVAPHAAAQTICLSSPNIPTGKVVTGSLYSPTCSGSFNTINALTLGNPDTSFPICTNWLRTAQNPAGIYSLPANWFGPVAEIWAPQCDNVFPQRIVPPVFGQRNAWFIRCEGTGCPVVTPPPTIVKVALTDSAVFLQRYAPDSLATIFGTNLAESTQSTNTFACVTRMGRSSVIFEDRNAKAIPACLLYVSPTQINFVIPNDTYFAQDGTQGSKSKAYVFKESSPTSYTHVTQDVRVTGVAPSVFQTAAGGVLFRKFVPAANLLRVRDGAQTWENLIDGGGLPIPIDMGPDGDLIFLILYGTGLRNKSASASVSATVGGIPADVQFAGAHGSLIGVDQINLFLPRERFLDLHGPAEIVLRVDDFGRTDKPEANRTWVVFN